MRKAEEITRDLTEIHPNVKREFSGTCKVTINNKEFNKLIKKESVDMEIAKEMLKGKKIAEVVKEWKKAEYVYAFRNSFRRALSTPNATTIVAMEEPEKLDGYSSFDEMLEGVAENE